MRRRTKSIIKIKSHTQSIIALILIIILLPIILILSLIVFIEDGNPILFKQKRLGLNNIEFVMFKLRTMKLNTPNLPSNMIRNKTYYKLNSGIWIRKIHFDEIFNLINVFRGEMNFIGYRPSLKSQLKLNSKRNEIGIVKFKPGVTGLAQVKGGDNLTLNNKLRFEKFYMNKKNLYLNLYIILLTFLPSSYEKI